VKERIMKGTLEAAPLKSDVKEGGVMEDFLTNEAAKWKNCETAAASMYQDQENYEKGYFPSHQGMVHVHFQHPGAIAVPGRGEEVSTLDTDSRTDHDPIAAEVVDTDVEKQLVREQVELGIQKERSKAPVAQVVEERFCDRRMIVMLALALLAILGVVLGVTLSREKGPPPAPVPSEEEIIDVLSVASFDGGEALQTPDSPQNRALAWLVNDTFQGYYTEDKLIQRYALATLFYSTNGDSWTSNSLWLDDGDECDRWWQFVGVVSCDSTTGGIMALGLGNNNLKGTIPPEIGLLTSLLELGLTENDLRGTFPTQIGELTSLEGLNLQKTKLSGSIPQQLANMTTLKSLSLAENELTGAFVQANIGKLTKLEDLMLYHNKLTGNLPGDISKLKNMKSLSLRENKLSGPIPSSIGRLTLMTEVQLYDNLLSGSIPSQIGLLTALTGLNLRSNNITGPLPSGIVKLTLLKTLGLRENLITGTIPSLITELTNLGEYTHTVSQCSHKYIHVMSHLILLVRYRNPRSPEQLPFWQDSDDHRSLDALDRAFSSRKFADRPNPFANLQADTAGELQHS